MALAHKARTRIKARLRVKSGDKGSRDKARTRIKARGSRDKARGSGDKARAKARLRVLVVAMAGEEEAIRLEASQGKMIRSLCQGRLVLVAARKAMMATTVLSRTA